MAPVFTTGRPLRGCRWPCCRAECGASPGPSPDDRRGGSPRDHRGARIEVIASSLASRRQRMSVVSRCPKCGQYVTLPPEVSPNATVRCPCCDAEFPLGEAAPAMPPALVPVEAADEEGPDLVVDAPMPALNGTEAAGLTVESENAAPADSDEPGTFDIQISEADRKKKRRPGPTAVYPDAIDIPAVGQNDMHSAAAIAARLRQNARRDNLSGELVKVVLGGRSRLGGRLLRAKLFRWSPIRQTSDLPAWLPAHVSPLVRRGRAKIAASSGRRRAGF